MLDSILLTGLLANVTKSSAGEAVSTILKLLTERAAQAEKNLDSMADSSEPLEIYRDQVIRKITLLRNRAALYVGELEIQQRIWCLLMGQTIASYEASTRRTLDLISANSEQVEAALDSYDRMLKDRRRTRIFAVLVSMASLVGIGAFLYYAHLRNISADFTLPVLGIPACVLLWSVVGSFAAILYRFTNAGDTQLEDPLRWLFSRPLTGIIMGAITYLVIKAGFLTIAVGTRSDSAAQFGTNEVMWLVAFLAGFSDRFADSLLRSLVGKFGGEADKELVSLQATSRITGEGLLSTLTSFLDQSGTASRAVEHPEVVPLSDTEEISEELSPI